MWAEMGGVPLEGGAGSASNNVARVETYHRSKWHIDPSSRLATSNMGRKLEAVYPFLGRRVGSPSSTMWPKVYVHIKWHLDLCSRLATIDKGRKLWGSVPFWGEGS